jgi:hypothetical protein
MTIRSRRTYHRGEAEALAFACAGHQLFKSDEETAK